MDKDKAMVSSLNEYNTKKIFVVNDISLSIVWSRTVQVDNGHFNVVLCVSSIFFNLLLVYKITHSSEGKTVEFFPHQVVIKGLKYPQHVLATGIVDDITRLYKFENFRSPYFPLVLFTYSNGLIKILHEFVGHLNYRSLQQLCNQRMVTSLLLVSCKDGVCTDWFLNKHRQEVFDKRVSWSNSTPLQLLESDLCVPISSPPFLGCKYFLTFIDDFSICTWVYFLKFKIKKFNNFLDYKALVEKKFGHQIQRLRTNNGGEYVNNNLTTYCIAYGIQMQYTIPYTPQHKCCC
jgi:hypothetical protein